jgi:formyl-CoA transferase
VAYNDKTLKIPGMVPKLSKTPGRTDWAGPEVGAYNEEILGGLLGLSENELKKLQDDGII